MLRPNTLKQKLKSKQTVLGTWCQIPSPVVANVIATSGLDFLVIDMEHGPMGYEMAGMMARATEAEGCSPIIRVMENREPVILRALELGAGSILVPHVENAEQAHQAVRASRYHPEGARGMSPHTRNHSYDHLLLEKTIPTTNQETFVGILVEGKEGIATLPEIAQVPGLDMVYLGIYDLSQSVGLPGQLQHPKVVEAIQKSVITLREKGMPAGTYAPDLEYAKLLIRLGFQFIAYSADVTALRRHYVTFKGSLAPVSAS